MSNNKQSNYNLMWAIAILREDYHHCWRLIAERMGCSEWKARYLYSRIKNNYKLWTKSNYLCIGCWKNNQHSETMTTCWCQPFGSNNPTSSTSFIGLNPGDCTRLNQSEEQDKRFKRTIHICEVTCTRHDKNIKLKSRKNLDIKLKCSIFEYYSSCVRDN